MASYHVFIWRDNGWKPTWWGLPEDDPRRRDTSLASSIRLTRNQAKRGLKLARIKIPDRRFIMRRLPE